MLGSKTWIITSIIITLLLGLALGVLVDRTSYYPHKAKDILEEHLLARLSRKLNLTRPQIQAIGGILRLQALKIEEIRKETQEKIKPHLTPEQQERLTKLIESHRKRWKRAWEKEKYCRF